MRYRIQAALCISLLFYHFRVVLFKFVIVHQMRSFAIVTELSSRLTNQLPAMDAACPPQIDICNHVFHQLHNDLRLYLNFHAIYPLLNNHHLLTEVDQSLLTDPRTTAEVKVDLVVSWVPKCGKPDYLTPFILCLRESAQQAGEIHLELAEELEKLRDAEMRKWQATQAREHLSAAGEGEDCEKDGGPTKGNVTVTCCILRSKSKKMRKPCNTKLSVAMVVSVLSVLMVASVVTSVTLNFVPSLPEETSVLVYDSNVMSLGEMIPHIYWLKSVDVAFGQKDQCSGKLFTVSNSCTSLATNRSKMVGSDQVNLFQVYALPGSVINITLKEGNQRDRDNGSHIWITDSIESFLALNDPSEEYQCKDNPSCFPAEDHRHEPIVYNVTTPGYYCIVETNSNDNKVLNVGSSANIEHWMFSRVTYNKSDISHPKNPKKKRETLRVSKSFDFSKREMCILLDFGCSWRNFSTVRISNMKRRIDVVLLINLVLLKLAILTLITAIFIHFYCKCRQQENRVHFLC